MEDITPWKQSPTRKGAIRVNLEQANDCYRQRRILEQIKGISEAKATKLSAEGMLTSISQ